MHREEVVRLFLATGPARVGAPLDLLIRGVGAGVPVCHDGRGRGSATLLLRPPLVTHSRHGPRDGTCSHSTASAASAPTLLLHLLLSLSIPTSTLTLLLPTNVHSYTAATHHLPPTDHYSPFHTGPDRPVRRRRVSVSVSETAARGAAAGDRLRSERLSSRFGLPTAHRPSKAVGQADPAARANLAGFTHMP